VKQRNASWLKERPSSLWDLDVAQSALQRNLTEESGREGGVYKNRPADSAAAYTFFAPAFGAFYFVGVNSFHEWNHLGESAEGKTTFRQVRKIIHKKWAKEVVEQLMIEFEFLVWHVQVSVHTRKD
jgi:hypothetical protein